MGSAVHFLYKSIWIISTPLLSSASTDGALSLWKYLYPRTESGNTHATPDRNEGGSSVPAGQPEAQCFLVLKPQLFDEQASVTDMSW